MRSTSVRTSLWRCHTEGIGTANGSKILTQSPVGQAGTSAFALPAINSPACTALQQPARLLHVHVIRPAQSLARGFLLLGSAVFRLLDWFFFQILLLTFYIF